MVLTEALCTLANIQILILLVAGLPSMVASALLLHSPDPAFLTLVSTVSQGTKVLVSLFVALACPRLVFIELHNRLEGLHVLGRAVSEVLVFESAFIVIFCLLILYSGLHWPPPNFLQGCILVSLLWPSI